MNPLRPRHRSADHRIHPSDRGIRPITGRRVMRLEVLEERHLLATDTIPLGSLVERTDFGPGTIAAAGEVDSFTLQLKAGQTLSAVVDAASGLAPTITALGPGGAVLATQTAAAGASAVISATPVATGGTYTLQVTGAGGSTGGYTLKSFLNAAIEAEGFGGATNQTAATAQNINVSLISWGSGSADRAAVFGTTDAGGTPDFYQFSTGSFATISLALGSTDGRLTLDLLDTSQNLLATGIAAENVPQWISRYAIAGPTTLLARVSPQGAAPGTEYSLIVTRGADFEAEPNLGFNQAQLASNVIGHVTTEDFSGTTVLRDFAGMDSRSTSCNCQPPDTHGAAGPNHYIEVVNTAITIYRKDGTIAQGPTEFTNFFDPVLVAGQAFDFDPVVAYDNLANRFVVAILIAASSSSAESDVLYAVSNTSDPTQGFTEQHRIDFGGVSPGLFVDYPKIGFNADAHVFSFNMFGAGFEKVDILAIDKSTVLDQNRATFSRFITSRPDTSFTMAAATMHESQPGDPMWFVEESGYGGTRTNVRVVRMDNPVSATPTYTEFLVTVASYGSGDLPNAPQPGGNFNTNDARMLNAELRGSRLVATHAVALGGKTVTRWYEFNIGGATPTLTQQGNIDPGAGIATYFPSIAINTRGDIGLTFMQSSATEFVSMYVTGQAFGSVPGTLSAPSLVKAGNETYPGSRGGDYSGITVDPVNDTFWAANEISLTGAPNPLWSTWIANFTVAPLPDNDWYRVAVSAGDLLVIETRTPFAGPGRIVNDLDPRLELYAPNGNLVASDDNSQGDGRNARINHVATVAGPYRVQVVGVNNSDGAYQMRITGNSVGDAAPQVVGLTPTSGLVLAAFPSEVRLDFSEALNLTTVTPSDLQIGGLPATSLTVVDGNTLAFGVNPAANTGDGTYSVQLTAGSVSDLQGTPGLAFSGSFVLDTTGPMLMQTLWNNASFPATRSFSPGALSFDARFNEDLFTLSSARLGLRTPGADDVVLTELVSGQSYAASNVTYDRLTFTFRADFANLPEGNYRLRLISGNGAFEDQVGNDLDGEPSLSSLDGTPTGNGTSGGDYLIDFLVDRGSTPVGVSDFVRRDVLGGFISSSTGNTGFMNFPGDADPFSFFAEAGETASFVATPSNPLATLRIDFAGSTATATTPGQPVVLELADIASTTVNSVTVTSDVASDYRLDIYRNASAAAIASEGGAVPLIGSGLALGTGERYAAVGQGRGSVGAPFFARQNNPSLFVDISTTGTPLNLEDDTEATILTTIGNSLFPAGVVTVGNNGGILTGEGRDLSASNSALPTADFAEALLPFWDDIDGGAGNVFWQERMVSGIPALIVQWENRPGYPAIGNATFQVQVFQSGPVAARFAYEDVNFGSAAFNFGAGATIGYQASSTSALTFSFNSASLANGDVLDLTLVPPAVDTDEFEIPLDVAGGPVDIALSGIEPSFGGATLSLIAPGGTVVATGVSNPLGIPATNLASAILNYVPTTAGIHRVRVTSTTTALYSLVVHQGVTLDVEPNSALTNPLRSLDATEVAAGFLDGSATQFVRYNDPMRFVNIATTGTPLNLGDDAETTITTTVGNASFPAGAVTVGNNGGILVGPGIDLSTTNIALPAASLGRALLPYWTDIDSDTGNVYWQELTLSGVRTLIVQWHNRPHYSNIGSATFQLQVFETGPVRARFVYSDIDFGDPSVSFGAGATIGYQDSPTSATQFSFNTTSIANGDVLDLVTTDTDYYVVNLSAGERLSVRTRTPFDNASNRPLNSLDPRVAILNAAGTTLASNTNSGPDGKNAFVRFTAPAAGSYRIAVISEFGEGEYLLNAAVNPLAGDFDFDGDLDCDDIDALTRAVAGSVQSPLFDVTGNGVVDFDDVTEWVVNLKDTLPGDANLDFVVDGSDFGIWNSNKFATGVAWCGGDFNADGVADGSDFGIWNQNKFRSAVPPAPALGAMLVVGNRSTPTRDGALATAAAAVASDRVREEDLGLAVVASMPWFGDLVSARVPTARWRGQVGPSDSSEGSRREEFIDTLFAELTA